MATLELEKHRAVAAPADYAARWSFRPEPASLQEMLATQDVDSVFAIEHKLRAGITLQHRPRKRQLLKASRRLPATVAMAFGRNKRRTIELDSHLRALARHNVLCHVATPWRLVLMPSDASNNGCLRAAKPFACHRFLSSLMGIVSLGQGGAQCRSARRLPLRQQALEKWSIERP